MAFTQNHLRFCMVQLVIVLLVRDKSLQRLLPIWISAAIIWTCLPDVWYHKWIAATCSYHVVVVRPNFYSNSNNLSLLLLRKIWLLLAVYFLTSDLLKLVPKLVGYECFRISWSIPIYHKAFSVVVNIHILFYPNFGWSQLRYFLLTHLVILNVKQKL